MLLAAACSDPTVPVPNDGRQEETNTSDDGGRRLPGKQLVVNLTAGQRTWVDLQALETHSATADSGVPEKWDIAFEGWEIYTNSGPSGVGSGAAFGPLDELSFLFDTVPEVPFLREDATGGAFLDWYAYDGSAHQLWSRYGIFGVERGELRYKVQLLGYYGEALGAPVSALYQLRYATISEDGVGATVEIANLDATAGYPDISDDAASGCLNLQSGEQLSLTPSQARASDAWDLCFRRDAISVNGEEGGPSNVAAVALGASNSATLDEIKQLTEEASLEAFEDVEFDDLSDPNLSYRGDHVVSAFEELWVENPGKGADAGDAVWLVRGGDGGSHYLFTVTDVQGSVEAATRVTLQIKRLED
jgi:hypothetical protein